MNTLATFFASIVALFSALLGHPTIIKEQVAPSQVFTQEKIATPSVITSTSSIDEQNIKVVSGITKFSEVRGGDVEQRESKTVIIGNDPVATINNDFKYGVTVVYTTKDKSKTYFALYKETEGQECIYLNYLDTIKSQYFNTELNYCPGYGGSPISDEAKNESLPFIVQYGKFHFDKLYALNLETGKEILVYSKKDDKESLIARCAEGMYDLTYAPDIESLGEKRIRIGVYKKTIDVDITKPCLKKKEYQKIRDDIIDLNTQI